jgi:hypothetical protein
MVVLRDSRSDTAETPFVNIGKEFRDERDTFVRGLPHQAVTAAGNDDQPGARNETRNDLRILR